jgi:cell division ATPase FtsA
MKIETKILEEENKQLTLIVEVDSKGMTKTYFRLIKKGEIRDFNNYNAAIRKYN